MILSATYANPRAQIIGRWYSSLDDTPAVGDQMAGKKVPTTLHLTERQNAAIAQEAKRQDISFADQCRRIFDEWMVKLPPRPTPGRMV